MTSAFTKYISNNKEYFYSTFRIMVGLLFVQHGLQKMFGWFGAQGPVELFSLFGFAGVVELVGGTLLVLGLFTRVAAFAGIVNMLGAYFTVHVSGGLAPIVNKGELALLYLATFLVLFSHGGQKWSLDSLIAGRSVGKKAKKE